MDLGLSFETYSGGNHWREWNLSLCTFPFSFRTQCNCDPVLVEEMTPRCQTGHFVALLMLAGETRSRKKEPSHIPLEIQFGGDVTS